MPTQTTTPQSHTEFALFGGGCFWCVEAVFKMIRGVTEVVSGYAGGQPGAKPPTYDTVSGGRTGHAEVIRITYDPAIISFADLLNVFFASHDPTTVNRQGADVGTQYRSVIFYTTPAQEQAAKAALADIEGAVTELLPYEAFYPAEDYHQDYYATHPGAPYCELVINPKLEKVQKKFADLLARNAANKI